MSFMDCSEFLGAYGFESDIPAMKARAESAGNSACVVLAASCLLRHRAVRAVARGHGDEVYGSTQATVTTLGCVQRDPRSVS